MENYARKSLDGVWVGDCVGNLGQIYFAHDILKALETGMAKFGGQLNQFHKQFQFSDDTEEAIVLYNHLVANNGEINQDKLAMEFATRYMDRDPDGEIYGYGLNTRKVLRDIYEGTPWRDANKFVKPKSEGMPSHIDSLVDSLSKGKDMKAAMHEVNLVLEKAKKGGTGELQGSCGNGSAMRVAPLGVFYPRGNPEVVVKQATLSAEPTHEHPEGIAGAIATAMTSFILRELYEEVMNNTDLYSQRTDLVGNVFLKTLLEYVPASEVKNGIVKATAISFDTPVGNVIEIIGNGTHVTCQDTVPFCCYMAAKAVSRFPVDEMYEKAIIETSMAFGDVDTNCAIVGGMLAPIVPVPNKWIQFCQPMEGVVDQTNDEMISSHVLLLADNRSLMAKKFQILAGIK